MFQKACDQARKYTCPYVGLRRKYDGTLFSTVAAFIVVNDEGWCITAKHLFDEIATAQQSIAEVAKLDQAIEAAKNSRSGDAKHRNRAVHDLERQRANLLSNHAEIWACGANWPVDKPHATDIRPHPVADLVAFKVAPFIPTPDPIYPVFRKGNLFPGLSVCRIGFPWHTVKLEFENNNFDVKGGFPAPLFALDGIVSRFVAEERPDGAKCTYVQTSTPGLRGQSGGPLFDAEGRLCGLQSSTIHLDLGFDAQYERDGKSIIERQFLNVGQAVHIDEIRKFLEGNAIAYKYA